MNIGVMSIHCPVFAAPVREILRPHEGNIFSINSSKSRARANIIIHFENPLLLMNKAFQK